MATSFETLSRQRPDRLPLPVKGRGDASEFLRKTTYGVALSALLFLTPFSLSNFFHQRTLLGMGSMAVVVMIALVAWLMHRGRSSTVTIMACVVPVSVLFLALAFRQQGIIGALWCYPAVIAFYFLLPERPAWIANAVLLCVEIPVAWHVLQPDVAARVAVTLIVSSLFSAIFIRLLMRQQFKLDRSELMRREGMAGMSHELRTPLATLNAQVDAMLDGIRPTDRQQVLLLSRSLESINGVVDNLYLLALADVGELVYRRERVRWDRIVDEATQAAANRLDERGIRLVTEIERPVVLQGDPQRLRQILDSLMENCHRYTLEGATVTVALICRHGQAELTVSDSGPGVSCEALPHLFERFYRVDSSRSRANGGAGLGLPLIKALAEAHGGSVSASHATQGGLHIGVTIPCTPTGMGIPEHAPVKQAE